MNAKQRKVAGIGKIMQKFRLKGSYTVEASLTIPIFLFVIFTAMQLGLQIYQEIQNQHEYEKVSQLWEVKEFYAVQGIGEVVSDQ